MSKVTITRASNPTKKANLTRASNQWSTRPADERFWDVPEFFAATKKIDAGRKAVVLPTKSLVAEYTEEGGLLLLQWSRDLSTTEIMVGASYA